MEEIDSYGPLGNHMRRRRNVTLNEPEDQRRSEQNADYGINWGNDSKIVAPSPYDENESEGNNPWQESSKTPLTNREETLALKDQEMTREFIIGGCPVTLGQLGTQVSKGSQKLTVYLDPELIDVMKELKKAKLVTNLSYLASEAIKQYLIVNSR